MYYYFVMTLETYEQVQFYSMIWEHQELPQYDHGANESLKYPIIIVTSWKIQQTKFTLIPHFSSSKAFLRFWQYSGKFFSPASMSNLSDPEPTM